jgi:hypothetical protein
MATTPKTDPRAARLEAIAAGSGTVSVTLALFVTRLTPPAPMVALP